MAMADDTLDPEAKLVVLAIELQMIPEAEVLYKICGRYDLLNELLQNCGRFEEALQIAESLDRVHSKNTYYEYAEWLNGNGDINNAMIYYSKANNTAHNVTQMLIREPSLLKVIFIFLLIKSIMALSIHTEQFVQQYLSDSTDPNMLKWWAQYTESTGDMNAALKIYQKAEDWFSQVKKSHIQTIIVYFMLRMASMTLISKLIFHFLCIRCEFSVSSVTNLLVNIWLDTMKISVKFKMPSNFTLALKRLWECGANMQRA